MSSILGRFGDKIIEEIKSIVSSKQKKNYADCIVRNDKDEILLLQRSYQDDFMPGKWCLPGGKIEAGENPTQAAQRELFEETGFQIPMDFVKIINKPDCTINYFQGYTLNNIDTTKQLLLDNSEHYRAEFVSIANLSDYDFILDLKEVLMNDLLPLLQFRPSVFEEEILTPEVAIAHESSAPFTHEEIVKSFDADEIDLNDFLNYLKRRDALETIKKGYDQGLVTDDKFIDALEKSKHYEFVKVVRDGKQFYQYREVGSNIIEEELPTGESVETSALLGLTIKKYSDKSFLITGDTYKNLDLLRKIKEDMGGMGSWNKALGGWIFPAFGKDKIIAAMASKMSIDTYDETKQKEAAIELKNAVEPGTPVVVAGVETKVEEVTTNEIGEVEYKTEVLGHDVTETEIAIPPADEKKAEELINNATEENRMRTGKELFGKEAGEKPVSDEIEKQGQKDMNIEVKKFTVRSGEEVDALDFTGVRQDEIQLYDVDKILHKPKPYYIPEINEYRYSGYKNNFFLFDYVKVDDNNFLVALNGFKKDGTIYNLDKRYKNVEPAYAVVSLDNLVAMGEYYKTKRKAELKRDAEIHNAEISEKYAKLTDEQIDKYNAFSYLRLSAAQQKKITSIEWKELPKDEKLKWVDGMTNPVYSKKSVGRIKPIDDDTMMRSNFDMYKLYVNKNYKSPFDRGSRRYASDDPCAVEYNEAREQIKWKKNDLEIQKEENDSSYSKGLETSWGDSNTRNDLLESHGVKIKTQNGKEMKVEQIEQIKDHLSKVYESFGNRSSMTKDFGLKISHAGEKKMFASKALGMYVPSMKAIGVSNDPENGKFGFTLAHEFSHFLDNATGKKNGRNYASDNYSSTAGQIASLFRKHMNEKTDSKYLNRSCEALARSFEQYHAMKHNGEDAVKYAWEGVPYHKRGEHVSKENFNTLIKPLIEQFIQENGELIKSSFDELNIAVENPFVWN